MKYRFHPEAEAEINDAVDYYEACREGLGLEFAREVHIAIKSICDFPLAWTSLSKHPQAPSQTFSLRCSLSIQG